MIRGNGMVIYIDPCNIAGNVAEDEMADLLFITHEHFGHCDPESIRMVRKSDCTTLIPENMSLQFRGDARRVMAGDSLTGDLSIKGVDIEVLATYMSCEGVRSPGAGVGYLFTLGGSKIYHAGHTCAIPDVGLHSPDIVLIPIGGHMTMDEAQAADAVSSISPGAVIPMGYDSDEDGMSAAREFMSIMEERSPATRVVIL
jgi:L-ascorbate metabolism protein UlaG (beta-lactamase superfamily)